jgi:fructose-1,6-bisphosphatase I
MRQPIEPPSTIAAVPAAGTHDVCSTHLLADLKEPATIFMAKQAPHAFVSLGAPKLRSTNIWGRVSVSVLPLETRHQRRFGAVRLRAALDLPMTLGQWVLQQERQHPETADLAPLITATATAGKQIASLVARAGVSNLTGLQGSVNVQGEEQKKLDVLTNEVLKNALRSTGKLGVLASEEENEPVSLMEEAYTGDFIAAFDPLDGSSNLDAAIATGTIFGVMRSGEHCLTGPEDADISQRQMQCLVQTLQPGANLVAAGYILYSSSVIFMLSIGHGVQGFSLDPAIGEFVLTHPDVRVPERGKIYSFNEANSDNWDPVLQEYIRSMKKKGYSSRYIGSLVGDVHRTLIYGGVFGYPGDKKNPNGKLRLLYECAPMAYLMEQAGGIATTGKQRILDIVPRDVHQREPFICGSPRDVEDLLKIYQGSMAMRG